MAAAQSLCMIPVMTDTILAEENARLKARLAETEAALADAVEAQKRLESIVSELRREKFGRKSEKLDPEQFNLPLEDIEVAKGVLDAAQEKARDALKGKGAGKNGKANRNRGHLPKHLPRIERVIEPETTLCPCGCGEMARIGEDVSERLDVVPAQFRVLVTRRPKYACRRCSGAVVQAHAPEHVVPGGLPTEALIAQVMVAKFGDHLPFYRQAEIYARQGITLDRATLGNWVGRACFHLRPVVDHLRERLKSADRIFMDDGRSIILMRDMKWEYLLADSERGVRISDEDFPDYEDAEDNEIQGIRIDNSVAEIETKHRRYRLDLRHVDEADLRAAKRILKKMNYDRRFQLTTG